MVEWFYKLKYKWACASGSIRRALGLSFRDSRTVSEIVYELELDPELRQLLREKRLEIRKQDNGS